MFSFYTIAIGYNCILQVIGSCTCSIKIPCVNNGNNNVLYGMSFGWRKTGEFPIRNFW